MNLSKENGYSFLLSQKGFLNDPYRRPFIGKKGRGTPHLVFNAKEARLPKSDYIVKLEIKPCTSKPKSMPITTRPLTLHCFICKSLSSYAQSLILLSLTFPFSLQLHDFLCTTYTLPFPFSLCHLHHLFPIYLCMCTNNCPFVCTYTF